MHSMEHPVSPNILFVFIVLDCKALVTGYKTSEASSGCKAALQSLAVILIILLQNGKIGNVASKDNVFSKE